MPTTVTLEYTLYNLINVKQAYLYASTWLLKIVTIRYVKFSDKSFNKIHRNCRGHPLLGKIPGGHMLKQNYAE